MTGAERGYQGWVGPRASAVGAPAAWLSWVVLLSAAVTGCQKRELVVTSRLEITVMVDPSLQLDDVVVNVASAARPALPPRSLGIPNGEPLRWQVVIADVAAPFLATIEAHGMRAGADVVVFSAGAMIGVNERVVATLFLDASCRSKYAQCGANQTCFKGACVTRPIFTGADGDAGIGVELPSDAGTSNDGRGGDSRAETAADALDAAPDVPVDLGSPDGGSDTAGPPDTGPMTTPAALSINPATKDFATVVTGLYAEASFQVSNSGGQSSTMPMVSIDDVDAAMFAVSASTCTTPIAASGSCVVTVRFSPTSAGMKTARLNVSASMGGAVNASLQGLAVPPGALTVTPTPQAFGSVLQGTQGTPIMLTVKNTGGAPTGALTTVVQGSTEFAITADACAAKILPAAGTCVISVAFAPASAGQKSGTLVVSANPGGTGSSSLSGVGLAPASLTIDPVSGTFATTTVGATGPAQTFKITNAGGVPAGGTTGVAAVVSGAQAAEFVPSANGCTGTLAPGASCTVTITFKPAAAGPRAASLTASAAPGGMIAASLSGSGVNPALLKLAAASGSQAAFGNVVSGTPVTQTFVVTNNGGQPSSAVTIAITGVGFSVATPAGDCISGTTTLAVNGTCTVHVVLSSMTIGTASGTLTASATAGGSSPLALTGTIVPQGTIMISPTTSPFGAFLPGTPSAAIPFTVTNTGGGPTGVLTASITGSTEFTISTDGCTGKTVAPGLTCGVSVILKPGSSGSKTGTLLVSGTPGGSATAALSGTGQVQAVLSVSPTSASFGSFVVGQPNPPVQVFKVTNGGDVSAGSTTALVPALSGTNAADFSISATDCGVTLPSKGSCNVSVVFSPMVAAAGRTATLTVSASPGGAPTATLTGTGLKAAKLTYSVASGSSAEFGSVVMSNSQSETFVVTNDGDQASTALTIGLTGTDFRLVTPPTGTDCVSVPAAGASVLAPHGTCTVRVMFTPTAVVSRTATLTVTAGTGGSDMLALHGTGLAPSALTLSQSSLNFGSVLQGGHGTLSFTLTNTGGASTGAIVTSLPAGEFAIVSGGDGCNGKVLAPTASCMISVSFNPTTASPTQKTATLSISANPGGSRPVSLSGLGVTLTIDAPSFAFPATATSGISPARSFTITNPTAGIAGMTTGLLPAFSGPAAGEFHVDSSTCSGALGGGGFCNVIVSFRPQTFGVRSATLTVSGVPGGSVSTALSGQGQAIDGTPDCAGDIDCQSLTCLLRFRDFDGDGWGDPLVTRKFCGTGQLSGYQTFAFDCDDADANMNVGTSRCHNTTTRDTCDNNGKLTTQVCPGGACIDSYCAGTQHQAGIFTCALFLPACTTAQGCSVQADNTGACNLAGTVTFLCDDTSDCGAGQKCCGFFVGGTEQSRACVDGACSTENNFGHTSAQWCDPVAPDCPVGFSCMRTFASNTTGQGLWLCGQNP